MEKANLGFELGEMYQVRKIYDWNLLANWLNQTLAGEEASELIAILADVKFSTCSIELKGGTKHMTNEPVKEFKVGAFRAAIFLNEHDGRMIPSVSLSKSFTKDGSKWERHKMTLLGAAEADKLISVLSECKEALYREDFQ